MKMIMKLNLNDIFMTVYENLTFVVTIINFLNMKVLVG